MQRGYELCWKGVTQDWAPELELGDVKSEEETEADVYGGRKQVLRGKLC